MRTSFALSILSLIFIAVVSCEKDPEPEVWTGKDYFPLTLGNAWVYDTGFTDSISKTATFDGKDYFYIEQKGGKTHTYIRKTEKGQVFYLTESGLEYLKFDLSIDEGDSWQYSTDQKCGKCGMWKAVLESKKESIMVGDVQVNNCYKFTFNLPNAEDAMYSVFLVPGIGIAKITVDFGQDSEVISARIDGKEIKIADKMLYDSAQ